VRISKGFCNGGEEMKPKDILKYLTIFFLGWTVKAFTWHFRFMDITLRRELILEMQTGNGYFLIFAYLNLLLTLITAGLTIYFNRKEWFAKDEGHAK